MPVNNQLFWAFGLHVDGDSDEILGSFNTLDLTNSMVFGDNNLINGHDNFIFGSSNTVDGYNNHLFGDGNTVLGNSNVIAGNASPKIDGDFDYVFGNDNHVIIGSDITLHGNQNILTGSRAVATGDGNTVNGNNATVKGNDNTIVYSLLPGDNITKVQGDHNTMFVGGSEHLTVAGDADTIRFQGVSAPSLVDLLNGHHAALDFSSATTGHAVVYGFDATDHNYLAVNETATYSNALGGKPVVDMHITGNGTASGVAFDVLSVGASIEQ